jgi:hypothetical protein
MFEAGQHHRAVQEEESKRYRFAAGGVGEALNRGNSSCPAVLLQRLVRCRQSHVQHRERSSRIVQI